VSTRTEGATINEPRINERIRVPEVRLVGPAGEQVGIVRIEDALRLAQESDLDLVEVAPDARPPVAKLMDYGKFKYEAAVKAREARRNQANTEIKEMRFRLKIDEHDYETKKGHVVRFLKGGDKVKVTIMFRGREQSRPEMGRRLLMKLADEVAEYAVVENAPNQEGRNMSLVLGPLKKKAEAKEEQRKAREAQKAAADAEREARRVPKAAEAVVEPDAVAEEVVEAPAEAVVEEVEEAVAEKPKPAPKPKAAPKPKPAATSAN
jgi:translation initiation factor IF-3